MSGKNVDFFKISDKALITKIVGVCHKHDIAIVGWLKDQSFRFETKALHFYQNLSKLALALPREYKTKDIADALAKQGSNTLFISFQIDTVNFFIKTEVSGFSDDADIQHLTVTIPKEIFKLQRRANLRIPFKRSMAPKLTCLDPTKDLAGKDQIEDSDVLSFRILDISAGGIAISIPESAGEKFPLGQMLEDVRFFIKGTQITCRALVRHKKSTKNDMDQKTYRIGLQYSALRSDFDKLISQFVLDESRKLFSLLH